MLKLGNTYTDKITGLSGTAVARIEYITGCVQYSLQPKGLKDGKMKEAQWFDEVRIDPDHKEGPKGGPGPTSLPKFERPS